MADTCSGVKYFFSNYIIVLLYLYQRLEPNSNVGSGFGSGSWEQKLGFSFSSGF